MGGPWSGRLTWYDDLGSYRFVPALLQNGLAADAEYAQVAALPEELLRTLDVYLDCGGNRAEAARQLFLHRNTLRQRMDRVAALLGVDLLPSSRWLSLHLAIKAARMSMPGPSAHGGTPKSAGRRLELRPQHGLAVFPPQPPARTRITGRTPQLRAVGA